MITLSEPAIRIYAKAFKDRIDELENSKISDDDKERVRNEIEKVYG